MNRDEKIAKILGVDICDTLDEQFMKKYDKIIIKLTGIRSGSLSTKREYKDLQQDGLVCLYESLEKYRFDKGVKFSTFFYTNLKRKVRIEFEGKYKGVKVSSHGRKKETRLLKEGKPEEAKRVSSHIFAVSSNILSEKIDINKEQEDITEIECYKMLKEHLTEEELYVISSLFGIVNPKKRIKDLAEKLNCSERRIHIIRTRCFGILKDNMEML